jgi:hypothetical protein
MEKPNADTTARFEALMPADPRAKPGQMFGHPCAFVNGNMFFGTFAQTLIARVGPDRAAALAGDGYVIFEPMAGRAWKEYVQFDPAEIPADEAVTLVGDALDFTAGLPPKPVKVAKSKAVTGKT